MTDALDPAARDFLRANTRTFLFTRRADGSPTGHPMLGLFGDDDVLRFSTYRRSAKVANLRRDDRVCCVVTAAEPATDPSRDPRALVLQGRARVVDDGSAPLAARAATATASDLEVPGTITRKAAERLRSGKRVVVEVVPERASFTTRPGGD